MIFALSTDERILHVFTSQEEATAHAEGVDVEAGEWLFFGAKGEILRPEFTVPNKWNRFFVVSGKYILVQCGDQADELSDILHTVAAVEGKEPFNTVEAVKKSLIDNRPGPPIGSAV
jgi:hypothetical protein